MDRIIAGENGQTMRTITVCKELENYYGKENVCSISSHIWRKHPFRFFLQIVHMAGTCKNIIIFPDQNGIKVILPLFFLLRIILGFNLYYNVVGAWLPDFLIQNKIIMYFVNNLDGIFVETKTLKHSLQSLGITKVVLFKNFKQLRVKNEIVDEKFDEPYKFCFFSRVTKLKGIEDAIEAVIEINKTSLRCILDIYGPVDPAYKEQFCLLESRFPEYIKYKGCVDAFQSVEIVSKYYIQLFPTLYKTEGIPGSIVDSYFSGTPIIASEWNSSRDVIDDSETGIIYEFGKKEELKKKYYLLLIIPR